MAEAPFDVRHGDDYAQVVRWMRDIEPPPFWAQQLEWIGEDPSRADRWQIVGFEPPSTIAIDVGVAVAGTGAPEGDRSRA